ncbi:hypothetical protein V497_07982 [Pseudogymnoascus sp. VKM F-4516 (FW-969)]|nr:hypothetical protein V497_07982 [Pseudogymnoascus sp. VKM F-4516 (FW-969)]
MDQLHSSTLLQPPSQWSTPTSKLHELPSSTMDRAKTPNGDSNLSPAMQAVNATIDKLKSKLLPPIPHLLSVPTSDPYRGSLPWETHRNSPFEAYEFDELQYMTLIPGDNRGVARPRGGWEDEINARSPYNVSRSRSGTTTPQQGERGSAKPRSKMSLADYKSGKRVPKSSAESQLPASEATKDKENVKLADKAQLGRAAQNGTTHSSDSRHYDAIKNEDAPRQSESRLPQSKTVAPQVKESDRHAPPPKAREQQHTTPKPSTIKQEVMHSLPPKPPAPNHAPKRPLEKPEQSQPEKRLKVEPKPAPGGAAKGHQRNTSDPLSRLFGTAPKSKPSSARQSQPTSVDNTPTKRAEDKKTLERGPGSGSKAKYTPPTTRVPEMPKLLSPLPEYLTSPTPVSFSSGQGAEKSGKNGRDSPSTMKPESSATKRKDQSEKTSPFRLPELLPRELPPNVEELLAKSKQPTRKHDTVQARHERSRNPDAPGVARKAPKPSAAEKRRASKASDSSPPEITYDPPHQIVKLKYKKSMSKDIQRILKMKPVPNRAILELADGIVPERPAVSKVKAAESKRPRPVPDEQAERSIKRAKVPAKIDSEKAASAQLLPPFKSPSLAPTSAKKLTTSASKVTPKKGDAMKSVAMRRVDSADDNTLTPKTGAASTPASTEKPRQNGSDPKSAEVERCRAANIKYSEMGKTLKRKRDVYIHSKENQLATLAGAESLLAYLVAFDAFDAMYRKMGRPNTGDNWLSLFPLLQANHDLGKAHLHLDIVILLIGGVASNALLAVHNLRFSKETPSNSPDYMKFRDAMSDNIRRNQEFWAQYQAACKELSSREPEAVRDGAGMAFVRTPGGQSLPVKTVKVEAAKMLKECGLGENALGTALWGTGGEKWLQHNWQFGYRLGLVGTTRKMSFFALPREALAELARKMPERSKQVVALGALVGPICAAPRNIVVYGLAATGKSAVVEGVLGALSRSEDAGEGVRYAVVRSKECITGRHLLERAVCAVADAVGWEGAAGRCENLAQLAVLLGKMLEGGKGRFVLVFDGVDKQRDAPPTLVPALARLGEVIPNLTTVFVVTSPRPHFLHNPGAPHIHFPPYTKAEAVTIVSRSVPSIYPSSPTEPASAPETDSNDNVSAEGENNIIPRPTAKETAELYSRFLSAVWDTFAKYAGRDILSFRRIAMTMWPRFTAPIRAGLYGPREFQRLLTSQRPLFRDESLLTPSIVDTSLPPPSTATTITPAKSLLPTTTISKTSTNTLASKHALTTPPIPYTSRILLIAAYLASYTPARLDTVLFAKSSGPTKKRRKNLGGNATKPRPGTAARRKLNRKLLGPQAFVMERCLAIFWALREEASGGGKAEAGGADILAAIAALGSLRLLGKTSKVADPLEGGCKWKVNVGWEVVRGVGRSVGIEVEEWIIE